MRTDLLGKPRSGQCTVFTVRGGQKVIAVVYAPHEFLHYVWSTLRIAQWRALGHPDVLDLSAPPITKRSITLRRSRSRAG